MRIALQKIGSNMELESFKRISVDLKVSNAAYWEGYGSKVLTYFARNFVIVRWSGLFGAHECNGFALV